jgi:class 3 adenylate cyclase/CHASE2 domain-containing sensor protein
MGLGAEGVMAKVIEGTARPIVQPKMTQPGKSGWFSEGTRDYFLPCGRGLGKKALFMSIRRLFEFLLRRRVLIQTAFVVVVTAVYVWMIQDQADWVRGFENSMLQWRMELWPQWQAPKDVIIIRLRSETFGILQQKKVDAETLARMPELRYLTNGWPWDRTLWARLTDRLLGAGARFVAYDLVFNGHTEGDAEFGRVLAKYSDPLHPERDRVAIASQLGGSVPGSEETIVQPEDIITAGIGPDIVGLIKLNEDDGLVRSIQHHWDLDFLDKIARFRNPNQPPKPHGDFSLSWLAAKRVLGEPPHRDFDTPMLLNYYVPNYATHNGADAGTDSGTDSTTNNVFETIPLEDVLINWGTKYKNGDYFKDKVVFVGPYDETRFSDNYNTPLQGFMTGVEIQATAYANLVHNEWLVPAPDWVVLALAVGLGALALAVSLYVHSVMVKMGLFVSLGAFFLVATQHLFWSNLFVTPVAGAAIILISTGVFGTLYDYVLGQYERQRMLGMFESMVSPGVAGLLLSHRGDFEKRLGGQRQEVVVLFGDIRGFTHWSEKVGAEALVAQLNEHLSAMVDIVQEEGGTVQKYIGDALMVAWGDVRAQPPAEGAEHAVRAALRMQAALHGLNVGWLNHPGREQLSFGIGINHGAGVVGRIGHPRRQEFTVMGDPVNLAARLESATKQYRQPILAGESIYEMTKELFIYRLVDKMTVKGQTRPVRVYAPLGELRDLPPPGLAAYAAALEKYYARDFAGAAELFRTANTQMGGADFLCGNFLERCLYCLQSPPPLDWDGSWVLKEK